MKLKIHHPNICSLRIKHVKIFSFSDWLIENGQDSNFENLDDASLNESCAISKLACKQKMATITLNQHLWALGQPYLEI